MTGVILYRSKYGATKKYAQWISEETGFPCRETSKTNIRDILFCDVIVLGGGIYAGGIAGLPFLKKHIQQLRGKKIIVFCDGASPCEAAEFQETLDRNMAGDLSGIPCFYCRGAWNMDIMNFTDRSLCKLLLSSVQKKKPEDCAVWERALREAGDQKCDWTDKKYIEPILREIYR